MERETITSICSLDKNRIIAGTLSGTIYAWNWNGTISDSRKCETEKEQDDLEIALVEVKPFIVHRFEDFHIKVITSVSETSFLMCGNFGLQLVNFEANQLIVAFKSEDAGNINSFVLMPNRSGIFSGDTSGRVCAWNMELKLISAANLTREIVCLAFCPVKEVIIAASYSGRIFELSHDLSKLKSQIKIKGVRGLTSLRVDPEGKWLWASSRHGVLQIHLETQTLLRTLPTISPATSFAVSESSNEIFIVGNDKYLLHYGSTFSLSGHVETLSLTNYALHLLPSADSEHSLVLVAGDSKFVLVYLDGIWLIAALLI